VQKIDFSTPRKLEAVIIVDDQDPPGAIELPIGRECGIRIILQKAPFNLLLAT
jgi:hypothetical protein